MEILAKDGISNTNLSVMGVGGGVLSNSYYEAARKVNQNGANGVSNTVDYIFMKNDPVPVLAGFNGFLGDGNILQSVLEFKNVYFTSNSAHSCYGTGAEGCVVIPSQAKDGPTPQRSATGNVIWYHNGKPNPEGK